MTHGALFNGIGGFMLAAQWAGIENVWCNEIDHFCCEVIRARIADGQIKDNVKIYEKDIREIGKHNLASVDIISGGDPCQPHSVAGLGKGENDNRFLWPKMFRIIQELHPSWIINENVDGAKGGRPPKPKKPNGLIGKPRKPKEPDTDTKDLEGELANSPLPLTQRYSKFIEFFNMVKLEETGRKGQFKGDSKSEILKHYNLSVISDSFSLIFKR